MTTFVTHRLARRLHIDLPEISMFETLDEDIRREDPAANTLRARCLRYATVGGIAVVLFGALYLVVQFLE